MDIIQLPAVPPTTPLRNALGIMRASHRSAIVTQGPAADPFLVSARDVRLGINRERRLLRDLEGLEMIPVSLVQLGPDVRALSEMSPLGDRHRRQNMASFGRFNLEQILSVTPGDYALLAQVPGVAFILTRHETRAELYADPPQRCACGNPTHIHEYGEADGVTSGQECRHCTYTITCD